VQQDIAVPKYLQRAYFYWFKTKVVGYHLDRDVRNFPYTREHDDLIDSPALPVVWPIQKVRPSETRVANLSNLVKIHAHAVLESSRLDDNLFELMNLY
jgi:hypothetical protein